MNMGPVLLIDVWKMSQQNIHNLIFFLFSHSDKTFTYQFSWYFLLYLKMHSFGYVRYHIELLTVNKCSWVHSI